MSKAARLDLPQEFGRVATLVDIERVVGDARATLCEQVGCGSGCTKDPLRPYGNDSGFFVMPAAQLLGWGVDTPAVLTDVLRMAYFAHLVYRVEDNAIDASYVDPVWTVKAGLARMLGDEALVALVGDDDAAALRKVQSAAYRTYARAVARQVAHRIDTDSSFTRDDIDRLGDLAAPMAVTVHTIAHIAGAAHRGSGVTEALTGLCTSLQLVDDLQDVCQDLADGNPTWVAATLRRTYPDVATWPAAQVYGAVHALGLGMHSLNLAQQYARGAARDLRVQEAEVLAKWADAWANLTGQMRADVATS